MVIGWPISEIQAFSDIVIMQAEDRCLIIKDDISKQNKQTTELNEVLENTEIMLNIKLELNLLGFMTYENIPSCLQISKRNKLNMQKI